MIRKSLIFLLLSALVFLSAQGIFSCRSVKRNAARADSTITRSEQTNLAWQTETVTEISLEPGELLPYIQGDSLGQFPDIFVPPAKHPRGLFVRLGLSGKDAQRTAKKRPAVDTSALISAPPRLIFRKTEKQAGHVEQKKQEEKQVQTYARNNYKEPNASGLLGVWLAVFCLLFILCRWAESKLK
ncbi:MAG: hypothetical protein ABIN80_02890 [Dyadobacter sp.]|uniref:hypothetical protein n=1 Tax=Dyadobacter sp. TaxID=1914288 RepID=UPI0032641D9D